MQTRASLAAWYALAILSIAVLYSVIDRQVLVLLAQPLKTGLHLSDTQIGSLQGLGAVLFSSIAVFPLGWLADRIDRRLILALCILVWSVAIASCGLAISYWTLLTSVAFLGAGEAGLSTIVYALVPDLFPERQRMTANIVFTTASVLGTGVGIALAGVAIQNIGLVSHMLPDSPFTRETWRLVFFVVAVPGPFLAIAIGLIRLKRRRPTARSKAAGPLAHDPSNLLRYVALNWKALFAVFVPFGMVLVGAGAIGLWMPIILMRQFGLTAGQVGAGWGAAFSVGSIGGLAAAGVVANYFRPRWGAMTPVRLSQFGYLAYALLSPLYFLARTPGEIFVIAAVQMGIGVGGNSLTPTLVQDMTPRALQGRIFAISTVIATLFQVISPIAVGLLSDHLFHQAGGLMKAAVTVAFPCILAAALIFRLAEKPIMTTIERVSALAEAD